ncbi:hypothetical protein [Streptomyces sp. YIM 130001]|uniref:hypothetical protein n=1 Tax=Streptomyces sp. YIM 130001 TaxID=2259644 RepID=UPI0013C4CB6C|nr:hypothetical protein [Streptomyces sp. YIM 130001]
MHRLGCNNHHAAFGLSTSVALALALALALPWLLGIGRLTLGKHKKRVPAVNGGNSARDGGLLACVCAFTAAARRAIQ